MLYSSIVLHWIFGSDLYGIPYLDNYLYIISRIDRHTLLDYLQYSFTYVTQ